MIDKNTLPYIDLGADSDTLRKYAKEYFGKMISSQAREDTVKDRFAAIYEEETGVKLAPISPLDDNEDDDLDDDPQEKVKSSSPPKRTPTHATIIIQDDPEDPQDVKVGAQFTPFLIKRNVEVKVPIAVLNALKDAKQDLYDHKTMEKKEVLAYPFSVLQLHFSDEE